MSLAKELQNRGFIHQFSNDKLELILDEEKRTVYHGIDPTSDSAHVGNMCTWMLLKHLANNGHKIIFLVGGGTGMIGDPKPDAERQLKTREEIDENVSKIKKQAEKFFTGIDIEFVDNYDWLNKLSLISFLRDIGKHFTVNELIKKEAISTRLQSENGLSYTEFAYPILQGFDYFRLFQDKDCTLQVGGSDQWGNMVAGVDLIRKKLQQEVFVVTTPLVIDKATGKKFGKSEGNAIWLDETKTSPYQFYQFWLNVSDESVIDHLKMFTLLELEEIEQIKKTFEGNPGERLAQKKLAEEVTTIVHGQQTMLLVQEVSNILFGNTTVKEISETGIELLLSLPPEVAPKHTIKNTTTLIDVLLETNLASSKREARTFIESGAIILNDEKIEDVNKNINEDDFIAGIALLRRGKKQYCVLVNT